MLFVFIIACVILSMVFDLRYTLVYAVGILVPFLSHLWHIFYGEDIVGNYCDEEWVHCIDDAGMYVFLLDSYEFTVVLEVWVCHALLFWFKTPQVVRYIAVVALILTIPLPIADLQVYVPIYNISSAVLTLAAFIVLFF